MNTVLGNLKILDFTSLLPGPFATLMLADMGADVIKINSRSRKDLILESTAKIDNRSSGLMWLNRNKRTISLNLKKKESIDIIKRMIMEYDIVIESFTPGVMDRLGLSYEVLSSINPKLIYCSLSSYGQNESLKNRSGHDINMMAESGISYMSCSPSLVSAQVGGLSASLNAVIGILSAVNFRNAEGKGQHIDISILDTLLSYNALEACDYLATGMEKLPATSLLNGGSLYNYYETSDGRYIAFGSIEDRFFKRFCSIVNRPDLADEGIFPDNISYVKDEIRKIFISQSYDYWTSLFKDENICISGVKSFDEVYSSDSVKERNSVVNLEGVNQPAMPIRFSEGGAVYNFAGREIGSDTEDVLEYFGYSSDEIKNFEKNDVFK